MGGPRTVSGCQTLRRKTRRLDLSCDGMMPQYAGRSLPAHSRPSGQRVSPIFTRSGAALLCSYPWIVPATARWLDECQHSESPSKICASKGQHARHLHVADAGGPALLVIRRMGEPNPSRTSEWGPFGSRATLARLSLPINLPAHVSSAASRRSKLSKERRRDRSILLCLARKGSFYHGVYRLWPLPLSTCSGGLRVLVVRGQTG